MRPGRESASVGLVWPLTLWMFTVLTLSAGSLLDATDAAVAWSPLPPSVLIVIAATLGVAVVALLAMLGRRQVAASGG